jgi:hypothetical protein
MHSMTDINLIALSPDDVLAPGEGSYTPERYSWRFLAQGDSWFSIGQIPFWSTTNLLEQMQLGQSACAVNCAYPGKELAHMMDTTTNKQFLSLLNGAQAWKWHAILLSGGGNDMIDFLEIDASSPRSGRLLLTSAEWNASDPPDARYISWDGWENFRQHMADVFDQLIVARDAGINQGVPIVFHTYDFLTPRDAPAGPGMGPWLWTALRAYAIPPADWDALCRRLMTELRSLLLGVVASRAGLSLHLVDTLGTLTPAPAGSTGSSPDWENEIHPTPAGYSQLARKWRPVIEAVLS